MLHTLAPLRRQGVTLVVILSGDVTILGLSACSDAPSTTKQVSPTSTYAAVHTSTPTASPAPQKLSATQKQQISADLNAALAHYVDEWHQGQQILGTTQYADANAGLQAFSDPNSAASRFSAWRTSTEIEQDVTTYINAYDHAAALYSADNTPQDLSNYELDMGTLQADISTWVQDAVGWQIQTTDSVTMTQDVQTIKKDMGQVQADITATIAAS